MRTSGKTGTDIKKTSKKKFPKYFFYGTEDKNRKALMCLSIFVNAVKMKKTALNKNWAAVACNLLENFIK